MNSKAGYVEQPINCRSFSEIRIRFPLAPKVNMARNEIHEAGKWCFTKWNFSKRKRYTLFPLGLGHLCFKVYQLYCLEMPLIFPYYALNIACYAR